MYLIEVKRNGKYIYDGALALAVQVYAQQNLFLGEDMVFPYITEPLVQVGRYQNAREEANLEYMKENGINLVRRDTGGGTIYLDMGGVNFCFVSDNTDLSADINFDQMYEPAIQILKELGLKNIEKSGRNDLHIDGRKVSGGAMSVVNGRTYSGYSLLLDIDEEKMEKSLRPNKKKMESKGIKSVRSRVVSLRDYLPDEYRHLSSIEFCELMILKIFNARDRSEVKTYELTDEDWRAIDKMMEEKYRNWEWTFGKSPRFKYSRDGRFSIGTLDITLDVDSGIIQHAKIYGDFFGSREINDVEKVLTGIKLKEEDLTAALGSIDLQKYLGSITKEEVVQLILE
ncbi:Lipoate-protein ligase LplJ [Jeotgalicoccus saudimassiliensis]|uniref:lipoate--protein ligase n=1 Tax=Jeotgalicoccus saudimassiliensis TaxID=1461582 RepID=A0A078M3W8_9STAP|nr:lipoate--protein ligase [Jeotgalicoccus saudimassiliensis]CEA00940.1 Lipoate-protein ligase LplJ [Jeotgalicoccus saudimassiliensis]